MSKHHRRKVDAFLFCETAFFFFFQNKLFQLVYIHFLHSLLFEFLVVAFTQECKIDFLYLTLKTSILLICMQHQ